MYCYLASRFFAGVALGFFLWGIDQWIELNETLRRAELFNDPGRSRPDVIPGTQEQARQPTRPIVTTNGTKARSGIS